MTHKIKVQMFGNFRMDYNGAPFVAEKMHKESQFNRMMQALIHYSDCGIAKDKLEEIVIGERDIDAPHTALRVIVYKTKQKLAQLGLPGKNLIYLEGGIYYWTPDIEIEEDAAEFEKLYNEACALEKQMPQEPESAETVCDERIKEIEDNMLELYVKALYLYKGEFLAAYTGETWIAQEARRYHTMFEKIINEAAYILRKRKQFKGLEKLGVYAAKVDPFNEWEELIMEAMVETRRYEEAEELYTDIVDYYLRECGIYPSSRLLEILEKYSNQMNHAHEILENIQEGMNEQEETERGGYFCSYPVFRGIYQASIRIMKRTRVPVYLMLCTLEDEEGRQVQSETKMNKYSRQLKKCVGESIRYSDIYTSYGKVQFLIPQYWSVRADGLNGAIYDNKTKKANIYFKNPIEKRMVSRVEWIDRNNTVYKVDYYNKYGYMYCSENVSGGNVTVREFYDRNGDIKVLEQTGPKTYTTFGTRISPKSYRGFADYLEAYLKYNKIYDENIWLTSDEILNKFAWDYGNFKISYLPQNRLNSDLTVITQTNTAFRILCSEEQQVNWYKENSNYKCDRLYSYLENNKSKFGRKEAFIITESDQLEYIEQLINDFPEITFHIAASTIMSDKLTRLDINNNVELYPCITEQKRKELFERCDIYLDINHYRELYNAVNEAMVNNMIILAFDNTAHSKELYPMGNIFESSNYVKMKETLKNIITSQTIFNEYIDRQKKQLKQLAAKVVMGDTDESI